MGMHYGYGWIIRYFPMEGVSDSLLMIFHTGGVNGFNALVSRIPSDKILVVLLNNTGDAPINEMNIAITNILYDKPYNKPKKS
jgi:CubicO group peptidase (beta-lactamase class C family)